MEKCRLCLELSENMFPIHGKGDGITFAHMVTALANIRIVIDDNLPNKICSFCRKKLTEAYNFKMCIERSEMLLNNSSSIKKFTFNNFHDIKMEIDCKPPVMPLQRIFTETLLKNGSQIITYNNTVIKRTQRYNNCKAQISVTKLLDSIKVESDVDYIDQSYDDDGIDYGSSSDYYEKEQLKYKKKNKKKQISKLKKPNMYEKQKHLSKPIKPVCLKDVIIQHTDKSNLKKNSKDQRKKYKYHDHTSICPYCGKLLKSKYLSIHMLQHTSDKMFKCDHCSKSFHTKTFLKWHIKKHTEPGRFKCNLCIASFNTKLTLNSHMLVHTEEKKHICNICNTGFKRLNALKRHKLVHNFGQKAVQCELCPMTFHSNTNLRNHMRVHTGERPYKCEICSQPYSYKHDFNRHCLKKHGVFLKRRSVYVMNEEVLKQEKALLRDLTLRAHGIIKGDLPSVYEGPLGALAFAQAMKAIEARQIPVNYIDTTH